MILSVHATFGAGVASLVPTHPVEAFAVGFVSHFLLDMIPHRDYDLISVELAAEGKPKLMEAVIRKFRLIRDVTLVSLDALVGLILAFIFFFNPSHPLIFFLGAAGALLPDFITFLYLLFKHKSLSFLTNIHIGLIHSKIRIKISQQTGVVLQFCTLAVLIAVIFGVKYFL